MMKSDDDKLSPEDRALFRDSVKDATPLGEKPAVKTQLTIKAPQTTQPEKSRKKITIRKESLLDFPLSDYSKETVTGDTVLEFSGKGISHKDMRRLKSGEFKVESALDLHGLTADEARQQILSFLDRAQQRGWHCVRIVHGKGKHGHETPVLKNLVNTWLRQLPNIIAFSSAKPRDGGAGAVYVLLVRD